MPTIEEELDSIYHLVEKQQQTASKRSKLLTALPVLIAIIFFSFIARAAGQYRQRLSVSESTLKQAQEEINKYKALLNQPRDDTNRMPDELADELNGYIQERDKISKEIENVLNSIGNLRNEISDAVRDLSINLPAADISLENALSIGNERKRRLKEISEFLERMKVGSENNTFNCHGIIADGLGMLNSLKDESASVSKAKDNVSKVRSNPNVISQKIDQITNKLTVLEEKQKALANVNKQIDDLRVRAAIRK